MAMRMFLCRGPNGSAYVFMHMHLVSKKRKLVPERQILNNKIDER
jgi:hypothetical protein